MTGLYLVYMRNPVLIEGDLMGAVELEHGLYIIRTRQTRSQLYHALKRRLEPAQLVVAPLKDIPKFKGMRRGATKDIKSMEA